MLSYWVGCAQASRNSKVETARWDIRSCTLHSKYSSTCVLDRFVPAVIGPPRLMFRHLPGLQQLAPGGYLAWRITFDDEFTGVNELWEDHGFISTYLSPPKTSNLPERPGRRA